MYDYRIDIELIKVIARMKDLKTVVLQLFVNYFEIEIFFTK